MVACADAVTAGNEPWIALRRSRLGSSAASGWATRRELLEDVPTATVDHEGHDELRPFCRSLDAGKGRPSRSRSRKSSKPISSAMVGATSARETRFVESDGSTPAPNRPAGPVRGTSRRSRGSSSGRVAPATVTPGVVRAVVRSREELQIAAPRRVVGAGDQVHVLGAEVSRHRLLDRPRIRASHAGSSGRGRRRPSRRRPRAPLRGRGAAAAPVRGCGHPLDRPGGQEGHGEAHEPGDDPSRALPASATASPTSAATSTRATRIGVRRDVTGPVSRTERGRRG